MQSTRHFFFLCSKFTKQRTKIYGSSYVEDRQWQDYYLNVHYKLLLDFLLETKVLPEKTCERWKKLRIESKVDKKKVVDKSLRYLKNSDLGFIVWKEMRLRQMA
ncbi:MAG: hypothetical protein CMB97_03240 [Flavobacteriaceae bacterium]|nr:hypothetical protein [Flavobacteriaceae bacterium]